MKAYFDKTKNLHTKPFQHKSPDLQHALSKPLYIRKMVKKGVATVAQNIIFSRNEKIFKNYRCDDPKQTKISKTFLE